MLTSNEVPNLDCMSKTELYNFSKKYRQPLIANFRDDFDPDSLNRKFEIGYKLSDYALKKALAMEYRERSIIKTALFYENSADKIYDNLPEKWRW